MRACACACTDSDSKRCIKPARKNALELFLIPFKLIKGFCLWHHHIKNLSLLIESGVIGVPFWYIGMSPFNCIPKCVKSIVK